MSTYKIARFSGLDEFLLNVGVARGKLKKGGVVDKEMSARLVVGDWQAGRIPFYTLPPERETGALQVVPGREGGRDRSIDRSVSAFFVLFCFALFTPRLRTRWHGGSLSTVHRMKRESVYLFSCGTALGCRAR